MKKILFLTGTRADFGKIKPLMNEVWKSGYDLRIFVTGMHMMSEYGSTRKEVEALPFGNKYYFCNQKKSDSMEVVLANTIMGLSDYLQVNEIDLIVVHGDRVEALAGAISGSLRNIQVAHIEGGEVSGTIDELIRHSVSKMSHLHFVANLEARDRLIQMGEDSGSIFEIGSPDLDVMSLDTLPSLDKVFSRYEIPSSFKDEGYLILLYHPVTTEYHLTRDHASNVVQSILKSNENFIVIYPNNDLGSEIILDEYRAFAGRSNIKVFPSVRFEYFLTMLKNTKGAVGNSSAGVRECPFYGVPSLNIGTRQNNRAKAQSIVNIDSDSVSGILSGIKIILEMERSDPDFSFGSGDSAKKFIDCITRTIANPSYGFGVQKQFVDINYL